MGSLDVGENTNNAVLGNLKSGSMPTVKFQTSISDFQFSTFVPSHMYHLVYTSHAVRPFSEEELIALLKECRAFNKVHNITGMLLYIQGKFIQVLEGSKTEVNNLFDLIATDKRHTRVAVISEGDSSHRIFKDWTMGFRRLTAQQANDLGGFKDIDAFFAKKNIKDKSSLLLIFLKLFYDRNMVEYADM